MMMLLLFFGVFYFVRGEVGVERMAFVVGDDFGIGVAGGGIVVVVVDGDGDGDEVESIGVVVGSVGPVDFDIVVEKKKVVAHFENVKKRGDEKEGGEGFDSLDDWKKNLLFLFLSNSCLLLWFLLVKIFQSKISKIL